ncbi:MAG TPA: hypothetical protein VMU18_10195 [Rhodoblastus sp.]|nr:hypothetical protein [Rhodoblastus sp.]
MANIRALASLLSLLGLAALGAGEARADGSRFGGWRFGAPLFGWRQFGAPSFAGPRYDGPRYDGPRAYDSEPLPPPDDFDAPPSEGRHIHPHGPPDGPPEGPPDRPPPGPRKCYSPAETRERVAGGKLREPYEMMRKASAMTHAEALAGKLCRWNDEDIYVISLLRRDGALIRVFMNAVTGKVVTGRDEH